MNKRKSAIPLTQTELETIRNLHINCQYTTQEIGKILARNPTTVGKHLHKMGIARTSSEAGRLAFKLGRRTTLRYWLGKPREKHPNWKGGKFSQAGYIFICPPINDPLKSMFDIKGYVFEHRYVVAKYFGRPLTKEEIVHHLNGIRNDNRLCNLVVLTRANHSAHLFLKLLQKRIRKLEAELTQRKLVL